MGPKAGVNAVFPAPGIEPCIMDASTHIGTTDGSACCCF
jgi:hypothetical protein